MSTRESDLSADPSWEDKDALWKKVGPSKSQVTRVCTSITKLTDRKFNLSVLQDAEKYREQVHQRFEALSAIMDHLSFFEPGEEKKNNEVVDQYQTKMEAAVDKLATYIADNTAKEGPATMSPATAPAAGARKERPPNKQLAPTVLTKDDTPERMRNWVADFTTFLQSGDAMEIATQQAYFRRLIDDHLRRAMEPHIMPNTPVIGKGGCLEILKNEFQVLYPIFARQVDFFKVAQAGGEDAISYLEKLTSLGLEANIEQLDLGVHYCVPVHLILHGPEAPGKAFWKQTKGPHGGEKDRQPTRAAEEIRRFHNGTRAGGRCSQAEAQGQAQTVPGQDYGGAQRQVP